MKIAILGAGRMGAWLASALAGEHDVVAFDLDSSRFGAIGNARGVSGLEAIGGHAPELLVNCVPLGMTVDAFETVVPLLPPSCMLSDIASVKTGLAAYYAGSGHPFVSTHPMFGPTYANSENLHEQNAVIITESCEEGRSFFLRVYQGLGITVYEDDFDGHDQTMAYSLGTPFASTMVFAACMKRLDAPGTNFRKHMEITRGLLAEDDRLLSEIMFNPYTIRQLELINSQVAYLTHIIKDRDHDEMSKFLRKLRSNLAHSDRKTPE
jgi:prephenate dehydrogenase